MNRIEYTFNALQKKNEKALISYVMAGDPSLSQSKKIIKHLEQHGTNLIEIGIPFSDPLADGPIIQMAGLRALKNNVTVDCVFELVKELRLETEIPIVLMVYYNLVFHYGVKAFMNMASKVGVNGFIIPDLPYEEEEEVTQYLTKELSLIPMITPTSQKRIKKILKDKTGFVYCVTSLATTGDDSNFNEELEKQIKDIRKVSNLPIALGFGIHNKEQVKPYLDSIDGYIVGSAIVKNIGENNGDLKTLSTVLRNIR